jgi:hypothetical protein
MRRCMAMSGRERAESCWEIESRSCGDVPRSYYVVLLKNKKAGKSVVKATSSDSQSMHRYVEQLRDDLHDLSDYEFVTKYELGSAA